MNDLIILNEFPQIDDFYKTYWGKKPFIVRKAIEQNIIDNLIDGDNLAGLSLDEDIKSRLVITESNNKWTCHHGPFQEDIFSTLGNSNWSLLVQNVDQYHLETAQLLKSFNFSPRWLIDDIMVSYSTVGGSVGPHTDSYHVFLVQGQGKRKWKISNNIIEDEEFIDNDDILVLKNGFEGNEVEVSTGDVIYIPPHFGHQGITTQEAMTFSVGFLGPKLSEMLGEFSLFLEQNTSLNKRYIGQDINSDSTTFSISQNAVSMMQNNLTDIIESSIFSEWIAEYFSTSSHEEFQNTKLGDDCISSEELLNILGDGKHLLRPEHIKLALTESDDGSINLGTYGEIITIPKKYSKVVDWLNQNHEISINDLDNEEILKFITQMHNKGILDFNM